MAFDLLSVREKCHARQSRQLVLKFKQEVVMIEYIMSDCHTGGCVISISVSLVLGTVGALCIVGALARNIYDKMKKTY